MTNIKINQVLLRETSIFGTLYGLYWATVNQGETNTQKLGN